MTRKIYFFKYIRVQPDQIEVLKGLAIPTCRNCTSMEINELIGIVGSIVMPHNIYFHSCLVLVIFQLKLKYSQIDDYNNF